MADTYTSSVAQVGSSYASALSKSSKSQLDLDMETFLSLIVSQIQNQDVLGMGSDGGSSNSADYVNQLLQMSVVQALNDVTEMSLTTYAMNMVGKEVTVAAIDGTKVVSETGIVTGVSLYGDEPILHVNGKEYSLSQVMVVGNTGASSTGGTTDADDEDTTVDGAEDVGGESGDTTEDGTENVDGTGGTEDSTTDGSAADGGAEA